MKQGKRINLLCGGWLKVCESYLSDVDQTKMFVVEVHASSIARGGIIKAASSEGWEQSGKLAFSSKAIPALIRVLKSLETS